MPQPPPVYVPPGSKLRSIVVDSGCSIHMFGDKSPFRALYPSCHTLVTADKKRHSVPAEGPAMLKAIDVSGRMQHISIGKALHCPGMHDLLSCSGILDAGGIVHLEDGNCYIKLKSNTMFPVQRRGRLFYLDSIERPNGTKIPEDNAHHTACNNVSACCNTDEQPTVPAPTPSHASAIALADEMQLIEQQLASHTPCTISSERCAQLYHTLLTEVDRRNITLPP